MKSIKNLIQKQTKFTIRNKSIQSNQLHGERFYRWFDEVHKI